MKSEIWEKFVGLTQSAEAKSFGRTRFALGSVFLAASQDKVSLREAFVRVRHHELGQQFAFDVEARQAVFFYRSSSLAGQDGLICVM
jgi:hypothetical protein